MGYMRGCLKRNRGGKERWVFRHRELVPFPDSVSTISWFSVGSRITAVCPEYYGVKETQSLAWRFLCFADHKDRILLRLDSLPQQKASLRVSLKPRSNYLARHHQ